MIGPDIGGFVGVGTGLNLFCGSFSGSKIVETAQVHIPVYGGGILGFDDVG